MSKARLSQDAGNLHQNEIRDYLARAPKRWSFNGSQMVNHFPHRVKWLLELCRGTIDERINRRAGVSFDWLYEPWRPSRQQSSYARKERRKNIIRYGRQKKSSAMVYL